MCVWLELSLSSPPPRVLNWDAQPSNAHVHASPDLPVLAHRISAVMEQRQQLDGADGAISDDDGDDLVQTPCLTPA
eukprot:scaffold99593_cov51-Prasinocladus_malaysianus.AAC.3